ncbi:hypothetical protein [Ideonella livida]|uniref:Lipoprotein n=1 Tax=Ideonella livida TaxID=2707176 RepID=A0A7C9TMS8_9BURK|nr:hypothetical protein [Ideonella livida]NDY92865.1 hypothetical protein [Ideonella livida]
MNLTTSPCARTAHRPTRRLFRASLAVWACAALLSACGGGGDDEEAPPAGGGSGSLTLSSATPSSHNTTLNLGAAGTAGNLARAADGFSAQPYCELFWENVPGANGSTYAVQVYFRPSDQAVLHASVIGSTGYTVFDNASGSPISGITVSTSGRTLSFTAKVLSGSGDGATGTVNGSVGFAANTANPACGA